ncbi:MAG: cation diffusion facilitator family transporter [Pseudonocardiaceae bacterium]
MGASRGHGHGGGGDPGHGHGVSAQTDRRWLSISLGLIVAFMTVEVVIGVLAGSLALLSDAAHMLTDAGSIVLTLVALRLAARPARGVFTYGLTRTEILSAQANGLTLLLLSVWLAYEAIQRLIAPPEVAGELVVITAVVGIVVNLAAAWAISHANRSSLNIEGAFQHILTDLFGFIATAVAGLVILLTGFARVDALASLVVVALMVKAGTGLVRDSGRIFLEAAPAGVDPDALGDRLVALPQVYEVHDLHVWQITSGQTALSAHVLVDPRTDCHALRRDVERVLATDYAITHTTLQVDHTGPTPSPLPANTTALPLAEARCDDRHGPIHRDNPHTH